MNAGPSGFHNAPITKGVVLLCGVASVLVGTTRGGIRACALSYYAILRKLQLWRLVTSTLVFSSTPELIFGIYLVYFFRVFERQVGSNKYAVFVLFSTALTTILELVVLTALRDPTSSGLTLSPGPYGLIFASFVPFFFDIPISTRFRVFGARFSDKSFIYLAGIQLLLSSWRRSIIPSICGILAGFAYRSNIFGVRRIKVPEFLTSLSARIFTPIISGGPVNQPRTNAAREAIAVSRGRQFEDRFVATAPPLAPVLPPSEESVATLVAMGFDRNMALQALARARNDVTIATNLLLESQSQ
ncbi:hypothetical protein O6H91_02G135000 [Diphasiastrum complanatum]|uniref:Uncharacterized protein n=3 Tax=Diphasiastrum complanatum TaxID=34168 RepID=A0ACC2EL04_DIPCM|nr:hypothetical protein O6H91_02G135000 [Diphasiastrum complanatum]KAJ7567179.1 hypothetical protein O6H91_02G135000 [Diphasiastrum complanatum]KAJ7567180.1 hypothetical protein O6H91_02G135000 [Diphasiastrum complanatum]